MSKRNTLRHLFFGLFLPFLALPAAPAAAVEVFPLAEVHAGLEGEVLTVLQGREPETLRVEVLGVLDDWIGPGVPLILGRFTDERGRFEGVAAGMSGSPVMIDGRLVGALSYSVGNFTKEPICGITPIEAMLRLGSLPAGELPWRREGRVAAVDGLLQAIPLAVGVRGVAADRLGAFDDLWREMGLAPAAAARPAAGAAAMGADDLQPGMPVSAMLIWGDKVVGATGTVTWREGSKLLAFGHPFLGRGRSGGPVAPAEIVWTVASGFNSFKISRYGAPAGTLTQDRLVGIAAEIGPVPQGLPIDVRVRRPGAPDIERHFQVLRSPRLVGPLANFALRSAVVDASGAELDETLRLEGNILLEGRAPVRVVIGGGAGPSPPVARIGAELARVLAALFQAPMEVPAVEGVELEVRAIERDGAWKVIRAVPDRLSVRAGGRLELRVELSGPRGERNWEVLDVEIPAGTLPGRCTVAVGSARTLDGELGAVAEARRRTARTADEYLAALASFSSDTLLEARLVRPAAGIVSRGREYPALPATAHLLLRSSPGGNELYHSRWRRLAGAWREMERSVTGLARLSLVIEAEESTE
ncbi:MAG: SpoIVB peptidase S55 domain-containing protein [Acidobacteriota bacterium]|nr:SpoIVB peptidase S55 domain-containing protein [Acidobacteriota bacterium]